MSTDVHMTAAIIDGGHFDTVRYPDDEILLRVTSGGNVQVIEYHSTDRDGPPAHSHPWHEVEFVIEGEVEFYLHGEWIRGGPGTVQMLPAGVAHSVRVPSGSAKLLYVTIGAPYDGLARELAALYATGQADLHNIVATANRHGLQLESDVTATNDEAIEVSTMTEQDKRNLAVVRKMYEGDASERANIARDIVWHVPGHNPVSGDYHGYQEYTELMVSRMMPLDRWDFTLEAAMVNGDYVMTILRVQGERKGTTIDLRGGHLMRVTTDGKVAEGWGFADDQDALDAFFSA